MLIATFGPTTEWVGKTITREGDVFTLEDHGPISAQDVMEYDRQGHLVWADGGTRAWVGSLAVTAASTPTVTTEGAASKSLEAAKRQFAAGSRKQALDTLGHVLPGAKTNPALAQELIELALAIRATDNPTLRSDCDELIAAAQEAIAGLSAPSPQSSNPYANKVDVRRDGRTSGQKAASLIGLLFLVVGLGVAVYFLVAFDVSVEVPYQDLGSGITVGGERVNNIGLMADRTNGTIIGFALAIGGGVLMVIGRKRARSPQTPVVARPSTANAAPAKGACNACGGLMDVGVAYCPHCGQKLTWTGVGGPPAAT